MANYDIVGNIAILKFSKGIKLKEKKKFAEKFLREHKNITTVLEKSEKIKGRLRTQNTKFIAGVKTKEAVYRENGCIFMLNVDSCYFSPRLASERLEIAKMCKPGEKVLVMFGGVAPFAIVIAKNSKCEKIVSVELGRECSKYALQNVRKNKIENVQIIQGDVRKKLPLIKEKFERVVMARPNLKDSFLDVAFPKVKKNGIIHYYGFYYEKEKEDMIKLIKDEAKKARKKIEIVRTKKAGEIAKKKYRWRVDLKILN